MRRLRVDSISNRVQFRYVLRKCYHPHTMNLRYRGTIFLIILGVGLVLPSKSLFTVSAQGTRQNDWRVAGQNISNSRYQDSERKIGVTNASQLSVKWSFTASNDVSATPTTAGNAVYFPDWGGNLYAVQADTGALIWSQPISAYNGHQGSISRVSPAVHGQDIIIGDILRIGVAHDGANIIAVDRQTGVLDWITHVDDHPAAIITGSPVVMGDIVYVGISSNEEGLAIVPGYRCCSFRGSVVALNANTGRVIWKRYTAPDGYSGNAVWQPPAIDLSRGSLYIGTGNNYTVPDAVNSCIATAPVNQQTGCFAADDYFDSALSLTLLTGKVKWSRRLQGVDVWTVACVVNPNPMSCPEPQSPDYDLSGSGPNLLPNLVGFGQKSGIYWALNPDNGALVWSSVVGPGGKGGGIQWGTATDGTRIYVAVANSSHLPYTLLNGQTVTGGAWSALDVNTGKLLWQTADPDQAVDGGSVSLANGVLFAPSASGNFRALNAATGQMLWSYFSGGSVIDGPSISNGVVFWGSGYKKAGTANNKVYAFSVPTAN